MRTAFEAYIAPARACGAWWRVLVGLLIVAFFWFGWSGLLLSAVSLGMLEPVGLGGNTAILSGAEGRRMPPDGILVLLLTFAGLWAGLWVALRLVHCRPFGTLFRPPGSGPSGFGPSGRPQGGTIRAGVLLALAFHAVGLTLYILFLGAPERTEMAFGTWLFWLIPIVLAIMVQASSEEVLFRGYLLQQFAVWSRNPLVWAVVPSLVFAIVHYDAQMEAGMLWRMLVHIAVFGLVAAALVWRTGGLGAAIGLHVTNNIVAICLFGIEGATFGFELWLFGEGALTRMFGVDLVTGLGMLALVLFVFPRKETA